MKYCLLLFSFIYLGVPFAKGQCACDAKPDLKERISCKPIIFRNKARLYRQYNCDSSWIVFQNSKGKRKILDSSVNEFVDLTGRLGCTYVMAYKKTFLIQDNVV